MAGDWIKLHRRIQDSAVGSDDWLCRLWIHCLVKAAWKPCYYKASPILAGSFGFTYRDWAVKLNVSRGKLERGLKKLQSLGQIAIKAANSRHSFSVVTICNWELYQSDSERLWDDNRADNGTITGPITGRKRDDNRAIEEEREERREGKEGREGAGIPAPVRDYSREPKGVLAVPEFQSLWVRWQDHLAEKTGTPMTAPMADSQLMHLTRMGLPKAIRDLELTLVKGAKSILDSDDTRGFGNGADPKRRKTAAEHMGLTKYDQK